VPYTIYIPEEQFNCCFGTSHQIALKTKSPKLMLSNDWPSPTGRRPLTGSRWPRPTGSGACASPASGTTTSPQSQSPLNLFLNLCLDHTTGRMQNFSIRNFGKSKNLPCLRIFLKFCKIVTKICNVSYLPYSKQHCLTYERSKLEFIHIYILVCIHSWCSDESVRMWIPHNCSVHFIGIQTSSLAGLEWDTNLFILILFLL
jgi:hypothetical protein